MKNLRKSILVFAVVFSILTYTFVRSAKAELCTIDAVPAATLLVPYFEVDLSKCDLDTGARTLVSLTNLNAAPAIAHVVVWTDLSIPLFAFDVFLTGYDVEDIDMKEVLCRGVIPKDGPTFPQPLTSTTLGHHNAWLQGKPSPLNGSCGSSPRSSDLAAGYITIDNVATLGLGFPTEGNSYFSQSSFENQLAGFVYFDSFREVEKVQLETRTVTTGLPLTQNCRKKKNSVRKKICRAKNRLIKNLPSFTESDLARTTALESIGLYGHPAIAIEADSNFTGGFNNESFYGRYTTGGADHREPLPSTFAVRHTQTVDPDDFDLIVWKNGFGVSAPTTCVGLPQGFPLTNTQLVIFNEVGEALEFQKAIPYETQLLEKFVDGLPFPKGWIYLNLNNGGTNGTSHSQAWVLERRNGIIDNNGVEALDKPCGEPIIF